MRAMTRTPRSAPFPAAAPKALGRRLSAWFERAQRTLPWRVDGPRDPYRVWLSEIMLQQTTVATVAPYYERFLKRWPTVAALAKADLDDVLHAWQGLGYYARARNLHRAAGVVAETLGGRFPDNEEGLNALPGVGAYTAAAVAAIAFGRRTVPVDGNVARVIARLHGRRFALPEDRDTIAARAKAMMPASYPGDFAEALMDLGATICTPRRPDCAACPWATACRARATGDPETFPGKKKKAARPVRHAVIFWAEDGGGRVLVRRRPERGLLGGMMEFPSTPWRDEPWEAKAARAHAPARGSWRVVGEEPLRHVFSHFELRGTVMRARVSGKTGAGAAVTGMTWWPVAKLGGLALPTAMKKAAKMAMTMSSGEVRKSRR